MNCHEVRHRIHDLLDDDLPVREVEIMEQHFEACPGCRMLFADLHWTKEVTARRFGLTEILEKQIWRNLCSERRRNLLFILRQAGEDFWDFLKNLEPRFIWSRLSAVPITAGFFVLILTQFPSLNRFEEWSYPAFSSAGSAAGHTELRARHNSAEISGLMTTAWKLPFEDSLSLVARVTPEGHAEIENVLQYPKSLQLLNAVDSTLRNAEFHSARRLLRPQLIVTFQKIDVYEPRGL